MFGFSLWDDHRRKPRKNPTHLHLQLYLCRTVSCAPKSWAQARLWKPRRVPQARWSAVTWKNIWDHQVKADAARDLGNDSRWKPCGMKQVHHFHMKGGVMSMSPMSHTMGWFLQTQFSDDCNGVPRTPDGTPGTPIPIIFPSYGSNMGMGLPSGPFSIPEKPVKFH